LTLLSIEVKYKGNLWISTQGRILSFLNKGKIGGEILYLQIEMNFDQVSETKPTVSLK
jgi:hypothetical protein